MKTAIRRLHLHGKIVVVANDAFQAVAVARRRHSELVACRGDPICFDSIVEDLFCGLGGSVGGKIGPEEATLTADRVTRRTFTLAEEYLPTAVRVSGKYTGLLRTLERAQILH